MKLHQTAPSNAPLEPKVKCASIDGDADRVVYFYIDDQKIFHLIDGDRIATLAAIYFKELIAASSLKLQLGLIQTAYANGGSTNYVIHHLVSNCIYNNIKRVLKLQKIIITVCHRKSQSVVYQLVSNIYIIKLLISTLEFILKLMAMVLLFLMIQLLK